MDTLQDVYSAELVRLAAAGASGEIARLLEGPYGAGIVNGVDAAGSTALAAAVARDRVAAARTLLRLGADPNLGNERQVTPLHLAASAEMAALLVEAGGDVHRRRADGSTPLHFAVTSAVATTLLAHGAAVNARNNGRTQPLHYAHTVGHARALLAHGAELDAPNAYGHTPMHLATSKGRWEVVWHLLSAGADAAATDKAGCTPLALSRALVGALASPGAATLSADDAAWARRLGKTAELLAAWSEQPDARALRHRFGWAAQARLCRCPRDALAARLPAELVDAIVCDFVGVFGRGAAVDGQGTWEERVRMSPAGLYRGRPLSPDAGPGRPSGRLLAAAAAVVVAVVAVLVRYLM